MCTYVYCKHQWLHHTNAELLKLSRRLGTSVIWGGRARNGVIPPLKKGYFFTLAKGKYCFLEGAGRSGSGNGKWDEIIFQRHSET